MKFSGEYPPGHVDVYPVGWCAALLRTWRSRNVPKSKTSGPWWPLSQEWRFTIRRVRERDWHAVKCTLNGYLAEPSDWPPGLRRCGSGWTPARARRDLDRRIRRAVGP